MNEYLVERIWTELNSWNRTERDYDLPEGSCRNDIREFTKWCKWTEIHSMDLTEKDVVAATEAYCEDRRLQVKNAGIVNRNIKYFTDKQIQDAIRELRGVVMERKRRRATARFDRDSNW